MLIERGQVFFVSLDPTVGREIGGNKTRPVVVLSINDLNVKPLVVTVVPGTSTRLNFRNCVAVSSSFSNGLKRDTFFMCHQVRAIDHQRFTRSAVGRLSGEDMRRIEEAVKFSLGLF